MATKQKAEETAAVFDMLASRFESISESILPDVADERLRLQVEFAGEWIVRLGIASGYQLPMPSEQASFAWLCFLVMLKSAFPTTSTARPGGFDPPVLEDVSRADADDGSEHVTITIPESNIRMDYTPLAAMHHGNTCRWIAWEYRTGGGQKIAEAGKKLRGSKNTELVDFASKNSHLSNKQIAGRWNKERPGEKATAESVRKAVERAASKNGQN